MRLRDAAVVGLTALAIASATTLPFLSRLDGYSIDVLFWLRYLVRGDAYDPASSSAAVIALDEETYRRPPFEGLPKVMWTNQLAQVMEAVLDGGAAVIGQDVVLTTSVETHLKGFDRPYLLTLRKSAREGRLVLGKLQHSKKPISPFPGYSFAVGNERNIRLLNVFQDDDGIIRRVPLAFKSIDPDGSIRLVPSMSVELAARASGDALQAVEQGGWRFGNYRIPVSDHGSSASNAMLLNFDSGRGGVPIYSLADLLACAQAGRADFFREHFEGRVVLLGTMLDVEDRKFTSKRFATGPDGDWPGARCVLPVMPDLYDSGIVRDTIPGVLVHATAVNNLLQRNLLRELSAGANWAIAVGLAGLAALLALLLAPWQTALGLAGAGLLWTGAAEAAFERGLVLPLFDPLVAAAATFAVVLGYRFVVSDKEKRMIRKAFAYYLPATVIDRMTARERMPSLGGEARELTVWFSDIAGFTGLSEKLSPPEVVRLLNAYLSEMTDLVEQHGGFVEKYVGDGIVAVFGAPLDDVEHALHAVQAALACQGRLADLQSVLPMPEGSRLAARIGINSGEVLIGNIGSKRRFNYTVMGDAVNLGSRLEGVNKLYGTDTLVSEETVRLCGDRLVFREIDKVRVVGRDAPVGIFQPLGAPEIISPRQRATADRYAAALEDFRARRFVEAATAFAALASEDAAAQALAARAQVFAADPPPDDWDGVADLTRK